MDAKVFLESDYYQTVLGALALIVVLAMALERALSVPFEWTLWSKWLEDKKLRAPIALVVAWIICVQMQLDLLLILTKAAKTWQGNFSVGTLITAGIVAGGSKGAILLFQGVLGFGKEAVDARVARRTITAATSDSAPPAGAPVRAVTTTQWWQRQK